MALFPAPPAFMGIINVTPDSFSDGTLDPHAAAAQARALAAQGAKILDLGAEASSFFRPGIVAVSAEEQLRRLLPVLGHLRTAPVDGALLSIDTRSAEVARQALRGGAQVINDISAGTHDAGLLSTVAEHQAGVILMHIMPTYPATPAGDDPDIVTAVCNYLLARAHAAHAAGIPPGHVALDPGIGFGKTMADNWRLALRSAELAARLAPYRLVVGGSRKRFLETAPPADAPLPRGWQALLQALGQSSLSVHPRDPASAALACLTPQAIHRQHNIALVASAAP